MGIKVFIVGYVRNVKSHFSTKQGVLATHSRLGQVTSFSRQITEWPDCTFCSIVLQLSWPFNFLHASHVWHFWWVTSRESLARILLIVHTLEFFIFSHTQPLHDSYLNTGFLIAELQANLAWNKANKWLNKFNLTSFKSNTITTNFSITFLQIAEVANSYYFASRFICNFSIFLILRDIKKFINLNFF